MSPANNKIYVGHH